VSLFLDPADLNAYGRNLAQLLLIGGTKLESLVAGSNRVTFSAWADAVSKEAQRRGLLTAVGQTEWLWECLTKEPRVSKELGDRILSLDEEWLLQKPIPVLTAGKRLGIFLKSFSSFGSQPAQLTVGAQPQAWIELHGDLVMAPRKRSFRRLECLDVDCHVEITLPDPGTAEQEAFRMKLEPADVSVDGQKVIAYAKSLNHALTVASRRMESHRRSNGGRAYDHIAWREGARWVSLEMIRSKAESGLWKMEGERQ